MNWDKKLTVEANELELETLLDSKTSLEVCAMALSAAEAGVENVHPHRFRHTFAHAWLSAGGQEVDLFPLRGRENRR